MVACCESSTVWEPTHADASLLLHSVHYDDRLHAARVSTEGTVDEVSQKVSSQFHAISGPSTAARKQGRHTNHGMAGLMHGLTDAFQQIPGLVYEMRRPTIAGHHAFPNTLSSTPGLPPSLANRPVPQLAQLPPAAYERLVKMLCPKGSVAVRRPCQQTCRGRVTVHVI
jgi:hypothetical protein